MAELSHSAEDAALGFYFQTTYALLAALRMQADDAVICVEGLDDVHVKLGAEDLLTQLKHSMGAPAPITIASVPLWRTLKVWIDVLPKISLSETHFRLVAVAPLGAQSPLECLLEEGSSRDELLDVLIQEAQRVVDERAEANSKGVKPLPHQQRISACETFIGLNAATRALLIQRIRIEPNTSNIVAVQAAIRDELTLFPANQRTPISERLQGWWDVQIVSSLCKKRDPFIAVSELKQSIAEIASELQKNTLIPEFETLTAPQDYQPDGLLAKQIKLVEGTDHDLRLAIREEWRARQQRSKWTNERLDMATKIALYDTVLTEAWADKHGHMANACASLTLKEMCVKGLDLLRWSHERAPLEVSPIAPGWNAHYYVRGSYQILAIGMEVGWHPNFKTLLTVTP